MRVTPCQMVCGLPLGRAEYRWPMLRYANANPYIEWNISGTEKGSTARGRPRGGLWEGCRKRGLKEGIPPWLGGQQNEV